MLRLTALCLAGTIVRRGEWSAARRILAIDGQNGKEYEEVRMGYTTVRVESRVCATCKSWKGSRRVERLGSAKVIRCDTARQPCCVKAGSMSTPGSCCGYWAKWSRI